MTEPSETKAALYRTEEMIGTAPVIVRRVVRWGESDYAQVVYTARFLDYALEAMEVWFHHVTGTDWSLYGVENKLLMPAKACDLDFHRPLRPNDPFDQTVRVTRLGTTSYTLAVAGTTLDGDPVYDANCTWVTIDPGEGKSIPMPDDLVDAIQAYVENGGGAEG